jgi:hypothetical protein
MAKISKENVRRRQSFCLAGHFACEIEAILTSCRLALNSMASNREGGFK